MSDKADEGAATQRGPCDVCGETECVTLGVRRSDDAQHAQERNARHWRLGYLRLAAALRTEREPPNRTDRAFRAGIADAARWVQEAWDDHRLPGANVIAVGLRAHAEVGPGNAAEGRPPKHFTQFPSLPYPEDRMTEAKAETSGAPAAGSAEPSVKRKGWTHAICDDCWDKRNPDRLAVRVRGVEAVDPCCFCQATAHGIYVRASPESVPLCEGHDR